MSVPVAGPDEIVLSVPDAEYLCAVNHQTVDLRAYFVVTFGQFGAVGRDEMWRQSWGKPYPLCRDCTGRAIELVRRARPHLVVRDLTQPPPGPNQPEPSQSATARDGSRGPGLDVSLPPLSLDGARAPYLPRGESR